MYARLWKLTFQKNQAPEGIAGLTAGNVALKVVRTFEAALYRAFFEVNE